MGKADSRSSAQTTNVTTTTTADIKDAFNQTTSTVENLQGAGTVTIGSLTPGNIPFILLSLAAVAVVWIFFRRKG